MTICDEFGDRMRELRKAHSISQDTLADRTGIHATAIGRLERGNREPRLTTIVRIARGLDVHPGELLDGVGEASEAVLPLTASPRAPPPHLQRGENQQSFPLEH